MFHATTILAVKKDGHTAVAGDGQVTMGNAVIMKNTARKVRRLYHGKVIAGFAGSVADAFALFDKFESKLVDCNGNLVRAAVEFAMEKRQGSTETGSAPDHDRRGASFPCIRKRGSHRT